ncbi:DNA cytosine methyltransferase [Methanosarcina sp. T3]|uniref:DNA cytosine methyltransferase n=1 Tax=Methanosarcina sp. T3 TaxID=3439062 RepID=UPI003F830AA2
MKEIAMPNYIDIFAGCGGLSLGLYNSGWKGIFAIEKSEYAFETLKYNLIENKNHFDWPPWLAEKEHDINNVLQKNKAELKKLRGTIDMVAGGPPCQGFSTAGRRNRDDERNKLVDSYVSFIELIRPQILFFENVRGFAAGFLDENNNRGEPISKKVITQLTGLGYTVKHRIIDFSDFGIPQKRMRFIIIGMLHHDPDHFFKDVYSSRHDFLKEKGLGISTTLEEAISDLRRVHGETKCPDFLTFQSGIYGKKESNYQKYLRDGYIKEVPDSHRFAKHKEATVGKFQYILDNCEKNKIIDKKIRELYDTNKHCITLLDGGSYCPTLTTLPDDYVHYCEPRILTVREYARIQSFNDWFEFKGKYTTGGKNRVKEVPRYSQVGNAIPPLFVEHVGNVLKKYICYN